MAVSSPLSSACVAINFTSSSPILFTTLLPDGTVCHCQQLSTHPGKLTFSLTGVFVASIFAGTFAFTVSFDQGLDKFWDNWNKGVRDFRSRYSLARTLL
jgi:ubiquinol-cytochrome c reductase subunit 9